MEEDGEGERKGEGARGGGNGDGERKKYDDCENKNLWDKSYVMKLRD